MANTEAIGTSELCKSYQQLIFSGNFMGDSGGRVLAKSLQINSKLRILKMDRNNISALGFHEIAHAMEKYDEAEFKPIFDVVASSCMEWKELEKLRVY